jgi:uncharacterized protein (TIGR03083 family)
VHSLSPILTAHLFPVLDQKLIELLRSLSKADWERPTVAPLWKVKDIVAHLLDGNLRMLSMARDGYFGVQPEGVDSYQSLVGFLNGLNADWVKASQRLSPSVLIDLLEWTGRQYNDYIVTLNDFEPAIFSVAWAGEQQSPNWFHLAREYTEKWHHQQQIRLAVGKDADLLTKELYFPYLETSLRALPHHYRDQSANADTLIHFHITGQAGGDWWLLYQNDGWELTSTATGTSTGRVILPGEIAWRIFTKGISRQEAAARVGITGDERLGRHILSMLAVMA